MAYPAPFIFVRELDIAGGAAQRCCGSSLEQF
jgi:hypothetical protein